MSDAIEYCPTCETNVACHMARACQSAVAHCAVATGSEIAVAVDAVLEAWDRGANYRDMAPAIAALRRESKTGREETGPCGGWPSVSEVTRTTKTARSVNRNLSPNSAGQAAGGQSQPTA